MKKGVLFLVPTPIEEMGQLEPMAFDRLKEAYEEGSLIAVEDLKPGRRRWISWGLPREQVDNFVLFNEHTYKKETDFLLNELKKGKDVFLMSDGGLPAFCDPGEDLVRRCHEGKIKVTALPFFNSVSLAVSLSGFPAAPMRFLGFPPVKGEERGKFYEELMQMPETLVFMDTPYRLKKVIAELKDSIPKRYCLFAVDLNRETEILKWGRISQLKGIEELGKREFVCVLGPKNF